MSKRIEEYEAELSKFQNIINSFSNKVAQAEKDKIVAQTKIDNYVANLQELEDECKTVTGRPIEEIDSVLEDTMNSIEKLVAQIDEALQEN